MMSVGVAISVVMGIGWVNQPYPADHDRAGLLPTASPLAVYHPDPSHWLNELHALLFIADRAPAEVAAVLPEEFRALHLTPEDFFKPGWYFKKRPGTEADRRVFGGDVRISPVEDLGGERGRRLQELLGQLSRAKPAVDDPVTQLLLQYDLLHIWTRWDRPETDPKTLTALAKAIQAIALPAEVLKSLSSGQDLLSSMRTDGPPDRTKPYIPAGFFDRKADSAWVEVDRDSTSVLFHAKNSLRVSRVFLNAGRRDQTLAAIAAGPEAELEPGTETALVFEMIGLDPDFRPVPTKVIDEFRVRRLTGPIELNPTNPTSSKDGWDQWVYFRSRSGASFRFLPDSTQSLFLEYGTAKHSTYAAQCALCHRATHSGGQAPLGIRTLAKHAKPRESTDPARLPRLAVEQLSPVIARLRQTAGN